jgi:glutaredoxin
MSNAANQSSSERCVVLYTRRGCHLCDEARLVLEQHGLALQLVDIDADERLRQRFDTCVPVVEIDGRVRFRGRVDPVLLRRILVHRAE